MSLHSSLIAAIARLVSAINAVDAKIVAGGGGLAIRALVVDLGPIARRSGHIIATMAGPLPVGTPATIAMGTGAVSGKGAQGDDAEMDGITATATVLTSTTVLIRWRSSGLQRGNIPFTLMIGA